jgi:DNA-binding MarR family transcriptional regulator
MVVVATKTSSTTKSAVAQEVWELLLDFFNQHRGQLFGMLGKLGLSPGDMKALFILDPDVPRPMGALAHAWDCDASNVTWIVDRLEERRFVERRMDPNDRRVKTVVLTPLGLKTRTKLQKGLYEPPGYLLALDSDTLEGLRDSMSKLLERRRRP